MNYSTTHLKLSRDFNSPNVLTAPQDFLGPNYATVINFWWYIDGLTEHQWTEVADRYYSLDYTFSRDAAGIAASYAAASVSGFATTMPRTTQLHATYELMGMHKLFERGKTLTFVPMFDFNGNYELHSLNVEDIESRIQRINDFIGPTLNVTIDNEQ